MTFAVFPPDLLPATFSYPPDFLALISRPALDLYPWWMIDADSDAGRLVYRITLGTGKHLVPFAKTDLYDDIACFNAAVPSSNPEIIMVCSTPDRAYGFPNFTAWHVQALKDVSALSASGT
ncbi:hypothetical protein [Xanthomonas sp. NCPPB 2632]|uniref:hypothetical protein n=1 Tax=Xanthomonas sp. NCPPB 2632 TaxID=3240912 RepID=UPI003513A12C